MDALQSRDHCTAPPRSKRRTGGEEDEEGESVVADVMVGGKF